MIYQPVDHVAVADSRLLQQFKIGDPPALPTVPPPPTAPAGRAEIVHQVLDFGSSTVDATSFLVPPAGAVSPGANRALYLAVLSIRASTPQPTSAGCGVTWVPIASVPFSAAARRLTVFRAMGNPTTGQITVDFGGLQNSVIWALVECAGVDTSGESGSGATVQVVTNTVAAGTSISASLAELEHANNLALVFVALQTQTTVVPDADFTELMDDSETASTGTLECQAAVNQRACDVAFATADAAIVAIEVKSGPA